MKTGIKEIAIYLSNATNFKNVTDYNYFVENKTSTTKNGNLTTNLYITSDKNYDVVESREENIITMCDKEIHRSSLAEELKTHKLTFDSIIYNKNKVIEYHKDNNVETKTRTEYDESTKTKSEVKVNNFINSDYDTNTVVITTTTKPGYYESITDFGNGSFISKSKSFDEKDRILSIIEINDSYTKIKKFNYDGIDNKASSITTTTTEKSTGKTTTEYESIIHRMDSKYKYQFNNFFSEDNELKESILTLSLIGKKSEYCEMKKNSKIITFYDRSKGLILKMDKAKMEVIEMYIDMQSGDEQLFVKIADFNVEYKYIKKDEFKIFGGISLGVEIENNMIFSILNNLYGGKLNDHIDLAGIKKIYDSMIWENNR